MKNIAIILGAGNSTRCGFDKILHEYHGTSNLERCKEIFVSNDLVDEVWCVVNKDQLGVLKNQEDFEISEKFKGFILGGAERFLSVKNAVEHCDELYEENVRLIFHNAANPRLSSTDLSEGIKYAEQKGNVVFGYFTSNSMKQVSKETGKIEAYLDREEIFETQTPQISDLDTFRTSFELFEKTKNSFPRDEAELIRLTGSEIFIYECATTNTKITYTDDFSGLGTGSRIGLGEDAHKFLETFDSTKPFRLGGIDVSENTLSSDGNSDGDLTFHALCNALLSAFGDKTFDTIAAPLCKAGDTNSRSYLDATISHLESEYNFEKKSVGQLLISLEGLRPKISHHHEAIVSNLSSIFGISRDRVGLTYTTGEGLNDYGKGLGMRAFVLVTLDA